MVLVFDNILPRMFSSLATLVIRRTFERLGKGIAGSVVSSPVVLLTSLEGKSNYLEAMEAGADDFMTKPFDADQLTGRIHVAERIISLQRRVAEGARELREKNEQMEKDLKMAHELQMALLPQQFPSIPRGAPPTIVRSIGAGHWK